MLENFYTTKMSMDKKKLQIRFSKIRSKSGRVSKLMAFVMTMLIAITMLCATVVMAALSNDEVIESQEYITLYAASGERVELQNKPFVKDNMTYFPLRETFEKLGVFKIEGNELIWDNGTIHIKVTNNTEREPVSYSIKINSDMIQIKNTYDVRLNLNVDAKPLVGVTLQLPEETPLLIGDITYVPYTFIDYMLNRGLGIRNHTGIYDFMFTINTNTPATFVSQGFVWPCEGTIANGYGERVHPITNEVKKHNGVDIVAPEGTDVLSAISGTVTDVGYDAEKGYYVIIERANMKTVYTSLMQVPQVNEGDTVLRGQAIGKVGKTGMSTGAHLHFEVLINGEYYNPELIS